ncbi:MAG: hypothetical protein ACE5D2_06525 [Fidelibacterota bacterium]
MIRLNITLPDEIGKELEGKPNKSRFIAEALREKIEWEKQKRLEQQLFEGYKATSNEDAELEDNWEKVEVEGWD